MPRQQQLRRLRSRKHKSLQIQLCERVPIRAAIIIRLYCREPTDELIKISQDDWYEITDPGRQCLNADQDLPCTHRNFVHLVRLGGWEFVSKEYREERTYQQELENSRHLADCSSVLGAELDVSDFKAPMLVFRTLPGLETVYMHAHGWPKRLARMKRTPERNALMQLHDGIRIGAWLSTAVEQLHSRGFVHHDLSLQNVLIDWTHKKAYLCDLEMVEAVDENGHCDPQRAGNGSQLTIAPEQQQQRKDDDLQPITSAIDVYAIGMNVNCAMYTSELQNMAFSIKPILDMMLQKRADLRPSAALCAQMFSRLLHDLRIT